MKKIFAGLLSVLLTINVNAALISFEIYDSKLYENRGSSNQVDGEEHSFIQSSELFEFSLAVNNIAPVRTHHFQPQEILGSQDQVIGFYDVKAAAAFIDLPAQEHPYYNEMNVLNLGYIVEDTDAITEYHYSVADLAAFHYSEVYLEAQNTDPLSYESSSDIDISIGYSSEMYWLKSEGGAITGQRLMSNYSIRFEEDTDLPFTSFDEENEFFSVLEQALVNGSEFRVYHDTTLVSFELTDPLGNPLCVGASYCEENEGIKILKEENFLYSGKARATAIDYTEVPEPSTNLLLAVGILGLVRLRKRHESQVS